MPFIIIIIIIIPMRCLRAPESRFFHKPSSLMFIMRIVVSDRVDTTALTPCMHSVCAGAGPGVKFIYSFIEIQRTRAMSAQENERRASSRVLCSSTGLDILLLGRAGLLWWLHGVVARWRVSRGEPQVRGCYRKPLAAYTSLALW